MRLQLKRKQMKNIDQYKKLCDILDQILIDTGMRDYCIECSIGNIGGCCGGCKFLSKKGCTAKSLSCKLWLCFYPSKFNLTTKKVEKYFKFLPLIRQIDRIGRRNKWTGFRMALGKGNKHLSKGGY